MRLRSTRRMIMPSIAPRGDRSLEGLLLGTPPSLLSEGHRRRRSAASEEDKLRSKPSEGRSCSKPPEEKRRDSKRGEGTEHGPKRQMARRFRRLLRRSNEDPRLRRGTKQGGPTVGTLHGVYSCNSTKLCRVLYYYVFAQGIFRDAGGWGAVKEFCPGSS